MEFQWVRIVLCLCSLLFVRGSMAQATSTFAVPGKSGGQSSVAAGELDGDLSNGTEIVIATIDGTVSAVRADGSLLWSREVPNRSCPFSPLTDKLYSSPVIGALNGDGVPFVVIGYGGFKGKACDGGVIAFKGSDGSTAWTFSIQKWAKKRGFEAFRNSVYSRPAVGDLDGDGRMEIGFGSFDRNVYLLNSNGTVRWYYNAADTVFSSPAFADVNDDGAGEMIIGTDISQNTRIKPATPNGGFLYAFRAKKPSKGGLRYLFRDINLQVWRTEFDQVVQSSPVVAELIADNPGPEVVVGTGCFFPQGGAERRGKYYRVVSARTGKVLRTLNVTACTPATPAVGDLDGDGKPEVVVSVSGDASAGGDGASHLLAWKPDADTVIWDVEPKLGDRTDRFGGHYNRSPVIADLTGDGRPEVSLAHSNGVVVVDGSSGRHLTCDQKPCLKPLLATESTVTGTLIIMDLNKDGRPEIVVSGRSGNGAALYLWEAIF
jgi:hypothetical protein